MEPMSEPRWIWAGRDGKKARLQRERSEQRLAGGGGGVGARARSRVKRGTDREAAAYK